LEFCVVCLELVALFPCVGKLLCHYLQLVLGVCEVLLNIRQSSLGIFELDPTGVGRAVGQQTLWPRVGVPPVHNIPVVVVQLVCVVERWPCG